MRNRFGNWGAGLSDAELACALAALGTLGPNADVSGSAERLSEAVGERVGDGSKPIEWRFNERGLILDASAFARAWRLFLESGGSGKARLQLSRLLLQIQKIDPSWLRQQLQRPEVQAASVEIVHAFGVPGYSIERSDPDRSTRGRDLTYSVPDETIEGGYEPAGAKPTPRILPGKPKPSARFLQAKLYDRTAPRKPLARLPPGASCIASIRVGLPDRTWTSVDRPFPTPEEPPEPPGHRLTVIFEEPRVSPVPQVRTVWLPQAGSSRPVHFPFEAPEDGSIAARITVLHANRVLQTGLLHSPGGDGDWTFKLDAMPRARLEGLAHRSQFDAAVIVDQNGRMTAAAEDKAVPLPLDEGALRELTEFLGTQLSAIAEDPDRYDSLESPGSRELLRKLAGMGAQVHRQVFQGLPQLAEARRVHITSANAGSFLPVELIYGFDPPAKTAQICPHARAALESGDCTSACPSDKRETICPLGFWGLSRVIERHGPERRSQTGAFEIRAEPCHPRTPLPLAGSALLAASDKTSTVRKEAVTELLRKLEARGTATLAKTWKEWERHVAKDRPHLLVILPHHERKDGLEVLEIGAGDSLESIEVHSSQIRKEPDGPHPIVLLMGCETNLAEVSFENFATLFRSWGASVVVSTIATVLGRHASPATVALVELLDQMADGQSTFGDVMLRLRQKLVATATPMALGLTSYGDADWILTRKEV